MVELFSKQLSELQNIIEFSKLKNHFFSSNKNVLVSPSIASYVSELEDNGVALIPNFLTKDQCDYILEHQPSKHEFMLSPEGDMSMFYLKANENPVFSDFFNDKRISEIMFSYIGESAIPLRQSMEVRKNIGVVNAFDRMYHMDTWKYRVKAFLYLHDVTMDDAPLCYLKRSHKGDWRLPMEYKMFTQYQTSGNGYASDLDKAWLGCYWPYEAAELKKEHDLEEFFCTGKAGTVILFDARGLHRATDLINEYRKVLINYYISEGNHI